MCWRRLFSILKIFKHRYILLIQIHWILQYNQVCSCKLFVTDQIPQIFCLQVQLLHCIPQVHPSRSLDCHQFGEVGEHFLRNRINIIAVLILIEFQRNQSTTVKFFSINRIRAVLFQPRYNMFNVEYSAGRRAYRMLEGLKRQRTVCIRQTFECLFLFTGDNTASSSVLADLSRPF